MEDSSIIKIGHNIKYDNAILKKDISKDELIKLEDVELNLPKEVVEARGYQYNLI